MARRIATKANLPPIQDAQPQADLPQIESAVDYLQHYGYIAGAILSAAVSPVAAIVSLAAAVCSFQEMAGLPITGQLDEPTVDKMKQPRCGVLDVQRLVEFARWRKNNLKFFVQSFVTQTQVSRDDQIALITLAWKQWEDHADIHLTPVTSASGADIVISTGKGRAQGMDGPSGTLAWAYLPNGSDGQLLMRFDIDETWTKAGSGIRYLNVACHEFGHLLGLDHSRVSSALMAPFYSAPITKPQANDDVARIAALYGPASPTSPPTVPVPPVGPGKLHVAMDADGRGMRVQIT